MATLQRESVWDYPRPPRLESVPERLRVVVGSVTIAETTRGYRVLETSHPPTYYIPRDDVRIDLLQRAQGSSMCEWKGSATYWDIAVGEDRRSRAAWSYEKPTREFAPIAGCLAFYASRVDACYVGDERVTPQPGDFYGGWTTERIIGPFKGAAGTSHY